MKLYPVIMAGGTGTRFWPLSREDKPKQFLKLAGGNSLFQRTVDRLSSFVPIEQIHIVAPPRYHDQISREVPELRQDAIIHEPAPRDTAPCIGLAAMELLSRDDEACMFVLPSDHHIPDPDKFYETLETAETVLDRRSESLVCFGITPERPETGYGYIQRGEQIMADTCRGVYRAEGFTEKPDRETAKQYLKAGVYYWNSGMFAWRADAILENLEVHAPDIYNELKTYHEQLESGDSRESLSDQFASIPAESIDYAVMEHATDVVVVEAAFQWEDMGTWDSIRTLLERDDSGNVVGSGGFPLKTRNSILYSNEDGHLVATLGVEDLVVVHTSDATLVCPIDRVQDVKSIVEKLEEIGENKYL